MKRSQRIEVAQRVADQREQSKAQALAASERSLQECEAKLRELEGYRLGYIKDFAQRASLGMDASRARDYQIFLARLDEALAQQSELVQRARALRDSERSGWQSAAQRADVVERMMQHVKSDEHRADEKREQLESDERSQRQWARGQTTRGT